MINTQITKSDNHFRILIALAVLTSLLAVTIVRPASASTTFSVNQTTDVSDQNLKDGVCDINSSVAGDQCTLRAAIEQTNATPGADTIEFDLFGGGIVALQPTSELPEIKGAVTINGYTQYGASVNTLARGTNAQLTVQLDGSKIVGAPTGLYVNAPNVVIRGLVIDNFVQGIVVDDAAADTKIEGNFIGTDPSGTKAEGNISGVTISDINSDTNNVVGGPTPDARNLISGNDQLGVYVASQGSEVSGNLIGTQRDGKSPLGNASDGVAIYGPYGLSYNGSNENTVGGPSRGYANTIAFNGGDGIDIYSPPGNDTALYNSVLSNSIFSNGDLGIDLDSDGATPNDAGDADKGPNHLQNKPVLSSAKKGAGKTTIKGKLSSTPDTGYKLQFFSNPKGIDEGKRLLFSRSVTTDGSGNVSFGFATKKVSLGQNITATATSSTGDTSEFSAPREVVAA